MCVCACVCGSVCAWMCVGTWVRGFLLICVPLRGYLGPCVRGCVLNFVHGKLFIKVHRHIVSCQLKLYSPFPLKIFEMLPKDLRKVPIVHIKNGDVCVYEMVIGRSLMLVPC